jgi:hypothetical protein
METTATLPNSATLANSELPARPHNNPPPWFAALSDDEFSAQIDARIDAARMPHARGRAHRLFDIADDDDLIEPVAAPEPSRRQRKRTLAFTLRAARKAGADRVIVDGVVIVLSPAAAVPASDSSSNEWDTVLEVDHGPH